MPDDRACINWLRHILSDPDRRRFYSTKWLEAAATELRALEEKNG